MPTTTYENLQHIINKGPIEIESGTGYLDLNGNELREAVVQNVATEPTSTSGQIILNTAKTDALLGNGKFGFRTSTQFVYPDMQKSVYDANGDGVVDLASNASNLGGYDSAYHLDRAHHTGTQSSTTISDFSEAVSDKVGSMLIDTNSVDLTFTDAGDMIKADLRLNGTDLRVGASGVDLNPTGVTAGTYPKTTVDSKGRVTGGSALVAGDIPAHNQTASTITDFVTAAQAIAINTFTVPSASLSMNSKTIVNVADPVNDTDAVNKRWVETKLTGIDWKENCRVVATGNITLSGTQTIDSIGVVAGDRVLTIGQTDATANGIYIVAAGAWTRATDADSWGEIVGAIVQVTSGTVNAGKVFQSMAITGGSLGATAINWRPFGEVANYTAGDAISLAGNTIAVQYDNQSITVTSNQLVVKLDSAGALAKSASGLAVQVDSNSMQIATNKVGIKLASNSGLQTGASGVSAKVDNYTIGINASGQLESKTAFRVQKDVQTITGNGTQTSFPLTNVIGNENLDVNVFDVTTGNKVGVDINLTSTVVTISTGSYAIANGRQLRVVMIG